ncbi:hypothetical protein BC941DRAFT_421328 [Chlamydoabsidia padenii]|nr:hypothetical protein BC941DRAFT_421328 [Chlamydoabsidia padenii]
MFFKVQGLLFIGCLIIQMGLILLATVTDGLSFIHWKEGNMEIRVIKNGTIIVIIISIIIYVGVGEKKDDKDKPEV